MADTDPSLFERAFLQLTRGASNETLSAVIETALRTRDALTPVTYSRSLRILSQNDGALRHDSKNFCIFVTMCRGKIPHFTRTALEALARAKVNTVVVNIGKIRHPEARETLDRLSHTFIERRNVGRDFGAFKDAYFLVKKNNPERLFFLNDSLYFLDKGLDAFIEGIFTSQQDVSAATETHEPYFHVQSFAVCVNKRVLDHKLFDKYWKDYLPISTRRWSIQNGEMGLSYVLRQKIGASVEVLYTADRLLNEVRPEPIDGLYGVSGIMPSHFRLKIFPEIAERLQSMVSGQYANLMRAASSRSPSEVAATPKRADKHDFDGILSSTSSHQAGMIDYSNIESLYFTCNYIGQRNGMSLGGFPFIRYLDMPMFKRDIVYRDLYTIPEVSDFLKTVPMDQALRDEIVNDLRMKGYSHGLKGIKRFMYQNGMA